MALIGRTHRPVEFKHQNISAVLDELGLPWIAGYKPKRNYQRAIIDAVGRYLARHPETVGRVPESKPAGVISRVFVAPPVLVSDSVAIPAPLRSLIRRFDPAERGHRNAALGKAGESFVLDLERRRLAEAGRLDLARGVRWVSVEEGDGAGYDILSFGSGGGERLIEVKTTNGSARTPFYLSRNEYETAGKRPAVWRRRWRRR